MNYHILFYTAACLASFIVFMVECGPKDVPNAMCFVASLGFFILATFFHAIL